ncbi:hypothetical protein KKF84_16460 [Myxococcota bacterium]|nr:hypothetical protein [Myxococcota bacterium]
MIAGSSTPIHIRGHHPGSLGNSAGPVCHAGSSRRPGDGSSLCETQSHPAARPLDTPTVRKKLRPGSNARDSGDSIYPRERDPEAPGVVYCDACGLVYNVNYNSSPLGQCLNSQIQILSLLKVHGTANSLI